MGRRENFINTINHIKPEKLILDLGGCPLSSMHGKSEGYLLDFLGFKPEEKLQKFTANQQDRRIDERILNYLDIDTRSTGEILIPERSLYRKLSDSEYIDEWGIIRCFTGMYWDITHSPLQGADVDDLHRFSWPDPESVDINKVEFFRDRAKWLYENTDYIVCAEHPIYGIFELGCWLCGFDDFLIKMAVDTDFIKNLFERLLYYQKKIIEIYYGLLGPYIHYTSSGDDFATQASSFMSPDMFNKLIKPYLKERIQYTKKFTNAAFLHHSCGNVFHLIPFLIDAGVDILNPIQPVNHDMSPESLKKNFGSRICFHGGIDTQSTLTFGKGESIRSEVKSVIDVMSEDGGYFFAAAHNIQEDVPPENLVIMFKAARDLYKVL